MIRTGCIRDRHDPRDYRYGDSRLAGAMPLVGSSTDIDLRQWMPPIRDQRYNNCVAHATMGAVEGLATEKGVTIATPSVMFPYANARLLDASHPMTDTGCQTRQLFKGLSSRTMLDARGFVFGLGCVPESDYPEASAPVNAVPPYDLYRDGANATIQNYYRIADGDTDGLIHALQRGHFPTICLVVDQTFADLGGGVYTAPGGPLLGGHATLCVGYSETAHAFRIRNSWGEGWGQDGYGWLDVALVKARCWDHWVLDVLPEAA